MERQTLCLPDHGTRDVLQAGNPAFPRELKRLYDPAESDALEAMVQLKRALQTLPTDEFWPAVTEGAAKILGADMSFIMKRVLVDDHDSAVEMPPYGQPGSCMMATAFHYCSSDGSKTTVKGTKFSVHGCPCAYMRHDKVFLIPENLNNFITNNPNKLPTPAEAYMAVPLFAEGKCFAHFGAMWSQEAALHRRLSWSFIELLLHSLEDMIQYQFVQGTIFPRPSAVPESYRVIPHDAVTVAQSLRPYAGSLSHELRTPMQGIVGMLDVMYATVEEAVRSEIDTKLRKVFEDLKENIQVVQDSSRRAVEAADNVVHAYDMDMSVPEAPGLPLLDDPESASPFSPNAPEKRPEIFVAGSNLPLTRKRRRDDTCSSRQGSGAGNKVQRLESVASVWSQAQESHQDARDGLQEGDEVRSYAKSGPTLADASAAEDIELAATNLSIPSRSIVPGLRHTNIRDVFRYVISEGLKMGGRPDSAMVQETMFGETIEVRSRGSDGIAKTKWVEWSVDATLPTTIFIDEKDLSKLISCVILNALKFTDQNGGHVGIHARMSSRAKYISVKISDNGPGIPAAFLPKLFKPFSRENGSTTRSSEGLGLGLMVAKGIARKLGGDLMCIRAETQGPSHGSEFEIRLPVIAGETISRPASPFGSPFPRRASLAPLDTSRVPAAPSMLESPRSPSRLSHALHEAVHAGSFGPDQVTSSPTSPKTKVGYMIHMEPPVTVTSSPPTPPPGATSIIPRPRIRKSVSNPEIDRDLANKYPLSFLVAEDNKINRKLLVSMLGKFGYRGVCEAHDGAEAVRQMKLKRDSGEHIDVVLMDLWMPLMDGYEATQRILSETDEESKGSNGSSSPIKKPTVLAVTADVTDGAQERAARVGMKGFMTKPYKINDLQRLITEYCAQRENVPAGLAAGSMHR